MSTCQCSPLHLIWYCMGGGATGTPRSGLSEAIGTNLQVEQGLFQAGHDDGLEYVIDGDVESSNVQA